MFATLETRGPSNDSVLKMTTTWGRRIALLALITLLAAGLSFADGKKHKLSKDLDALKGGHYTVPVESLDALANDPDVAYISPDREVSGSLDYVTSAVGAPIAWNVYGLDGSGVGVAVIDSGIHKSSDFKNASGSNRVVYEQDFVGGGTDDFYGHGTHVAGIAGSTGKGSTCSNCTRTFKGVAPNVNLINLRVLDKNGAGTDSRVISAIQKAISLKDTYNIRVINLSLGRPVQESYT